MKILVVSNLYPPDVMGGYELGCRQVVEALLRKGHDVQVLTTVPRVPVRPLPQVCRVFHLADVYTPQLQEGLSPLGHVLRHADACWVRAFNVQVLLEHLAEFTPDVVYLWNLVGLGGLGLLGCLHHQGVPWLWHLMDKTPRDLCTLPWEPGSEQLGSAMAPLLDGLYLACSCRLVEEIQRHVPLPSSAVTLLPNWVVAPLWRRRRWYAGGVLRIATAAGHLCREKGIDMLIDAAGLLRQYGYDKFFMALFGRTDDDFSRLVQARGLQEHVHFAGFLEQDELARHYADCDVFAFPTWPREPFGFAPLEAAAQGCVPLITDDCGIGEWLVHGVHCLKAPRVAAAFADAFADILRGRTELARLGRRAAAVVAEEFHLRRLLPRIEAALRQAAERQRPALGLPEEAYHLALLGEKLGGALVQDLVAC
jgi:glycosyltransferase involved in cell wall biosynthesis